jgi:catechol 2,3-dioxygenase-like lactoylglutathione lyase family enzyme
MTVVTGLHHITCISGAAQDNVDFYSGVLGMRLVKKSVNQDSPGTYHLFYADADGHPGTDITFFPWPEMPPAKEGAGLATEVSLAIPLGAIDYWIGRLGEHHIAVGEIETRRATSAVTSAIHTDCRCRCMRLGTIASSPPGPTAAFRPRNRSADCIPCGCGSAISHCHLLS